MDNLHLYKVDDMQKKYDGIDIAKAVLSLFVMLIHLNPLRGGGEYEDLIFPITRIAVPLFFVISSYFLFSKIKYIWINDKKVIFNFISRNLMLYAFWFIVLLPITFYTKGYLNLGILEFCITIIRDFLFKSTFRASWFIVALIEGVLIIYGLRKVLSSRIVIVVTAVIYIFCCMGSNYSGFFSTSDLFLKLVASFPGNIYNSFLSGLLWIALGMSLSEKGEIEKKDFLEQLEIFPSDYCINCNLIWGTNYY